MSLEYRPRVLLADDSPELLLALRRLLNPRFDVVGTVSSGREAIEAATNLRPDVVVLDVWMHDLNGLDACDHIKRQTPDMSVVLLTAADDEALRTSAFRAGASAFIAKHAVADELEGTIQRIVAMNRSS